MRLTKGRFSVLIVSYLLALLSLRRLHLCDWSLFVIHVPEVNMTSNYVKLNLRLLLLIIFFVWILIKVWAYVLINYIHELLVQLSNLLGINMFIDGVLVELHHLIQ